MELTDGQETVLAAFKRLGAVEDVVLAAYVHHVADMSSSGVRSRRAELVRKGLVTPVAVTTLRSGRKALVHNLTPAGKRTANKRPKTAKQVTA